MSTAVALATEEKSLLHELRSLPGRESQREFLATHKHRLSLQLVLDLAKEVHALVRVNAGESLNLAELAIDVADLIGDPLAMAYAVRSKANALYMQGNYASAVDTNNQAIQLFEQVGHTEELGRTLLGCIGPLNLCGQYDVAFEAAERARAIFTESGDELRLARLDINVGNVYYRQDRFADALACYRRAYDGVTKHQNREGIAAVLSNLSVCLIGLGEFQEALDTYQRARDYCDQHGMSLLVAQADYNIAYLHFLRGEYSRAIDMLRSTRLLCNEIGDRYH